MALKVVNLGQNVGTFGPDVALIHDPGTDNLTLFNAGYIGGRIVALKTSATAGRGVVVVPCDAASMTPVGALLNGPGEFAGAIGPSGSGKIGYVRGLPQILVDFNSYVAAPVAQYLVGQPVYCGTGVNAGMFTADQPTGTGAYTKPVGIINAIPTATTPWLGVDFGL